MCPATGSIGSTSPRYRSGARASRTATSPSRGTSASRSIVRDQASRSVRRPGGYDRDGIGHRAARREPRLDPAVEDADARVAEVVEHPPQPRGDRAASVVVGDDVARRRRSPGSARRSRERSRVGERMAPGTLGPDEVMVDVDEDRTGQVRGLVVAASLARIGKPPADIGDAQRGVVEAREEVVHGDQRAVRASPGSLRHGRVDPCYPVARRGDCAPDDRPRPGRPSLRRSSVVERVTVNHLVVGSNPTAGANAPRTK